MPRPREVEQPGVCCFGLTIDTINLSGTRLCSVSHESGPRMIAPSPSQRSRMSKKVEWPRMHKVILMNDDPTPRVFVVTALKAEFR